MNRPKVVVYNEASADGRVAVSRERLLLYGDERWQALSAPADVDVHTWLRTVHPVTATLEGSGSFVPDGGELQPLPPAEGDTASLYADFLPGAVVSRPGHRGWFTVVDGRGRVRWMYKEYPDPAWAGWHLLVLVAHTTPAEYLAYLQREQIPYLVAGEGQVDLATALAKLREKLEVGCLLSTAGGRLNGALLRAGVVDEVNLVLHPALVGGTDTPALFDSPPLPDTELPTRLTLLAAQVEASGRLWLRYAVRRNETT